MTGNQIWAVVCLGSSVIFIIMAIAFALLKEKGAMLISGFNTLSKEKREQYDKRKMSADMRNSLLLWSTILFIGGVLSYLISFYFAIGALVVWIVLFFKEVKLDTEKAFNKYRL